MTTHKMESLIYTYFESGSLVIVPRVTKNNAWLDTETEPIIWRSIVNHECGIPYRKIECYRKPKINKEAKPINDIVLSKIYRLGYLRYWNYRMSGGNQ